jgi:hypothetical protein
MNTPRRIFAVASASALALTLAAVPASARWLTPDPTVMTPTNATLRVDSAAHVASDGLTVKWPVQFTCPKGETYSLDLIVIERNPVAVPELYGEDDGIRATAISSGTCTGKKQHFLGDLTTIATYGGYGFFPISPTAAVNTSSQAILTSATGWAGWCSAPNCAADTGPRITLR